MTALNTEILTSVLGIVYFELEIDKMLDEDVDEKSTVFYILIERISMELHT